MENAWGLKLCALIHEIKNILIFNAYIFSARSLSLSLSFPKASYTYTEWVWFGKKFLQTEAHRSRDSSIRENGSAMISNFG